MYILHVHDRSRRYARNTDHHSANPRSPPSPQCAAEHRTGRPSPAPRLYSLPYGGSTVCIYMAHPAPRHKGPTAADILWTAHSSHAEHRYVALYRWTGYLSTNSCTHAATLVVEGTVREKGPPPIIDELHHTDWDSTNGWILSLRRTGTHHVHYYQTTIGADSVDSPWRALHTKSCSDDLLGEARHSIGAHMVYPVNGKRIYCICRKVSPGSSRLGQEEVLWMRDGGHHHRIDSTLDVL
jgi:hypothetical protein